MTRKFRPQRTSLTPRRAGFRPRVEVLEDRCLLSTLIDPPGNLREITVMSRNLYVGADFAPIFDTTAPGGPIFQASLAWNDVKQTNFPLRAEALADEIADNNPDLIGLQEVSGWYSGPADGGPYFGQPATIVEYDFLEILRSELTERGLHYAVVAELKVFDEELPIFPDLTKPLIPANMKDFRVIDREVILARTDLPVSQLTLSNAQTGHYTSHVVSTLAVPGFPSVAISFDRGWASVDVKVRGKDFRFITTHLEPEETAPTIQVAQAAELLAGPANTPMPVILVGDLNSRADGSGTASYANLINTGFRDAWSDTQPSELGNTHGHTELLHDRLDTAGFDRRIDLVLFRGDLLALASDVVGEETTDFDAYGIWASDHAGVVATIGIHVRPQDEPGHAALLTTTADFMPYGWEDLSFDVFQTGRGKKSPRFSVSW